MGVVIKLDFFLFRFSCPNSMLRSERSWEGIRDERRKIAQTETQEKEREREKAKMQLIIHNFADVSNRIDESSAR